MPKDWPLSLRNICWVGGWLGAVDGFFAFGAFLAATFFSAGEATTAATTAVSDIMIFDCLKKFTHVIT